MECQAVEQLAHGAVITLHLAEDCRFRDVQQQATTGLRPLTKTVLPSVVQIYFLGLQRQVIADLSR